MYMSYCRYEGTYRELAACLRDAQEHIDEEAEYEVSDGEIRHFQNMIELFHEFLRDNDLTDDEGRLDWPAIEAVCEKMKRRYAEEDDDE